MGLPASMHCLNSFPDLSMTFLLPYNNSDVLAYNDNLVQKKCSFVESKREVSILPAM